MKNYQAMKNYEITIKTTSFKSGVLDTNFAKHVTELNTKDQMHIKFQLDLKTLSEGFECRFELHLGTQNGSANTDAM